MFSAHFLTLWFVKFFFCILSPFLHIFVMWQFVPLDFGGEFVIAMCKDFPCGFGNFRHLQGILEVRFLDVICVLDWLLQYLKM
jgi:hypothetical protein